MIPYGMVVRDNNSGMLSIVIPSPDFMSAAFKKGDFLAAHMRPHGRDITNEKNVEVIGHINEARTIEIIKKHGFIVKEQQDEKD